MKRLLCVITVSVLCILSFGCSRISNVQIAATTAPVYEFASRICTGTDLNVGLIITESVSCLHDYTLQTGQMRMIENSQILIISGAGLEGFLSDVLPASNDVIDASETIELLCSESEHDHSHNGHEDHHDHDPHIWLSPKNARQMALNISAGLAKKYPQYAKQFDDNLQTLLEDIDAVQQYGNKQLKSLSCRQLITFHDGFAYLADAFDLHILHAIEEESGSEASAAELIEICDMVNLHHIPSIFTELNGSASAAQTVANETGIQAFQLDMAMSGNGYFNAMYHNIDTLKEALE